MSSGTIAPPATSLPRTRIEAHSGRRRLLWRNVTAYATLSVGSVLMIIPFLWMLSTSLKDDRQAYVFPPIWIPSPVAWNNYLDTWQALPFNLFFLNSAFVSLVLTVAQLATCSLGAFAFARLRFPG
ncbi:MAG: carbohydrate ABC transporter permease, partial [Caldilineaceae bacterium SB0666_bin_21]|nr:carbohydrate ABC transporter permease [Caldilineaceae bacterium SB0666_bin_21]